MNPNAASTASEGIASRPQELGEPGGGFGAGALDAAGAAGEDGVDLV